MLGLKLKAVFFFDKALTKKGKKLLNSHTVTSVGAIQVCEIAKNQTWLDSCIKIIMDLFLDEFIANERLDDSFRGLFSGLSSDCGTNSLLENRKRGAGDGD